MANEVYAIEMRNLATDEVHLCELQDSVCYLIGERQPMADTAADYNRLAKRKGWNSRCRAVPLPYTTSLPDWFDYA